MANRPDRPYSKTLFTTKNTKFAKKFKTEIILTLFYDFLRVLRDLRGEYIDSNHKITEYRV
jgi:hypothetical protein